MNQIYEEMIKTITSKLNMSFLMKLGLLEFNFIKCNKAKKNNN